MDERFHRLSLVIGEGEVTNLFFKTVMILGVGGVGGYVAESLVRSGIGNLILIDFDTVDITNINRHVIAFTSTVGKKKIEVLRERLVDINPECNVICYDYFVNKDNYIELFKNKVDYFVDACDFVEAKKAVIKYCLTKNIRIISSMGTGNRIDPSKLEIIDIKKTSYDPLARIIRKYLRDENINSSLMVLWSREIPIKTSGVVGSSAFVPSSAGILIASYIIKELIGYE